MSDRLIKLSILGLAGLSLLSLANHLPWSIESIPAIARPHSPQLKSMMPGAGDRANGLIQLKSNFSIEETTTRIESLLKERNLVLINKIDHGANAKSVKLALRPTRLFIFGNAKTGTPLMQCNQSIGIDLPMKALVWQDAQGQVWFGYNEPQYLKDRHQLQQCDRQINAASQAMKALATAITSDTPPSVP
jgi:uncharacterized protein (DUF302 family)